jgi:diaminohydroxyphosphoribosylaminopyrimidine deaminase/5-amino-6-(5-phosphoribosylamino)uracil reductase
VPFSTLDDERLTEALQAAGQAIGLSDPNPRVGCVIGLEDGTILGVGSTQQAGGPHAEVMALRACQAGGHSLLGATAWVSLEPCSHHGRTPPCCDALISAGIARVVVAVQDPHAKVAGRGISQLRAAGIRVDLAPDAFATASRELNIGFFSRHERGRPWVRLKAAISLDGRVALNNGQSQWITGPDARADGHAWRRRAGAIVTGSGTVLADDPRLDVRLVKTHLQPLRVVLDSSLRTPSAARILAPPGRVLILTSHADNSKSRELEAMGAEVCACPPGTVGVDLRAALQQLADREINEVHVEAGPKLSGAFIEADLADELLIYVAPSLLGSGLGLVNLPPLSNLAQAPRFTFLDSQPVGVDLRIRARRLGH